VSTDRIFDEESRAGRRGELRGAHRHIKPNRKPKRPRKKDWWDAVDDEFGPRTQRVMRRGEQERRAMVEAQASATLESVDEDAVQTTWEDEAAAGEMGLVLEVSSSVYRVAVDARVLLCSLRGSLTVEETGFTNRVAAGDRVRVTTPGGNRGVIEAILPRRSALARPDPFHPHRKQVIVANADQLLIVVSWLEPPLWHALIDRYLIGAERNRLVPTLCVNKIDLAENRSEVRASVAPYRALNYRVLLASAVTGEGVEALRAQVRGKTTVLAGMSGVGKSSLLQAMNPGLDLRTGGVSDHWGGQGRHTTSQVNLFALDDATYVADTPGIREFAVAGLPPRELLDFYPEIAELTARCRFRDCSHTHEPGCAVKAALERGELSETRYHNYCQILRELGG
jgi:ribosome biogenesis GTPase